MYPYRSLAEKYHRDHLEIIAQLADEFSEQNPDYPEALSFYMKFRHADFDIMGLSESEFQIAISQELETIGRIALCHDRNPAEIIYQLARLRGYRGKSNGLDSSSNGRCIGLSGTPWCFSGAKCA